jgi:hypothetical protein
MTLTQSHFMTERQPRTWLFGLILVSAIAIADSGALLELPNSYRTPMSDVIYEEQTSWRAAPQEDNGWRRGDDVAIDTRRRKEMWPAYDYTERGDPTLDNMFMNENELARPKTNVFRYTF